MKVFISWSGEPSRSIALALKQWLPAVVQHIDPWMSEEDITSGTRWNDEVGKALERAELGIVCVTAANSEQPWLIFEAGALAKRLATARVVPLCIDLKPAAITGPLAAFQARELDEDGIRRIVLDLMALREPPATEAQANMIFDSMWPLLQKKLAVAKNKTLAPKSPPRGVEEMLEEIVEYVRRIDRAESKLQAGREILVAQGCACGCG